MNEHCDDEHDVMMWMNFCHDELCVMMWLNFCHDELFEACNGSKDLCYDVWNDAWTCYDDWNDDWTPCDDWNYECTYYNDGNTCLMILDKWWWMNLLWELDEWSMSW